MLTLGRQDAQQSSLVPFPVVQPHAMMSQAILETLARAVLVYGRRNARILYDALGTLAEAVHGALAEPMFLGIIMPPLVQKWHAVPDTDRELLPLLECFMTLAHQLGEIPPSPRLTLLSSLWGHSPPFSDT